MTISKITRKGVNSIMYNSNNDFLRGKTLEQLEAVSGVKALFVAEFNNLKVYAAPVYIHNYLDVRLVVVNQTGEVLSKDCNTDAEVEDVKHYTGEMKVNKRTINRIEKDTPKEFDGKSYRNFASDFVGFNRPSNANWSYQVYAILCNDNIKLVTLRPCSDIISTSN